jgi:hypothetical protein
MGERTASDGLPLIHKDCGLRALEGIRHQPLMEEVGLYTPCQQAGLEDPFVQIFSILGEAFFTGMHQTLVPLDQISVAIKLKTTP